MSSQTEGLIVNVIKALYTSGRNLVVGFFVFEIFPNEILRENELFFKVIFIMRIQFTELINLAFDYSFPLYKMILLKLSLPRCSSTILITNFITDNLLGSRF